MAKATEADLRKEIVNLRMQLMLKEIGSSYCPFKMFPIENSTPECECQENMTCPEHKNIWYRLKKERNYRRSE